MLIVARALMAVGGALIWPACLSMTFAAFGPEGAGKAGAFVVGVAGLANALGPIDGGLLTDLASWRWVFVLNVPIALFAIAVVSRRVPRERPARTEAGLDGTGIALLAAGLLAFLLALDQGPLWGWGDARVIGLALAAVAAFALFALVQRRKGADALVPSDVIRHRDFAGACVAIAMSGISFGAVLLFLPQIVQKVLDGNALQSGLTLLPLLLTYALVSFVAPKLAKKVGAKAVLGGGVAIQAACQQVPPQAHAAFAATVETRIAIAWVFGCALEASHQAAVSTFEARVTFWNPALVVASAPRVDPGVRLSTAPPDRVQPP